MSSQIPDQARRAGRALDAANFFLADVRDGLGPYLAVYLLTEQHWDEAHRPCHVDCDDRRHRGADAGRCTGRCNASQAAGDGRRHHHGDGRLAVAAVVPNFLPVAISQSIAQAAAVVFPPAIAAVSLGIFGHAAFTRRIGRNETFNHAGASLVSILAIPARAINHDLARGLHAPDANEQPEHASGLSVLLTCRPLLIFGICVLLFHLSNAAMLPLVGQKLALQDENMGTSLMSACIVAAQLVMVPFAMLVGAKADRWGHKRFFLAALLILPLRGALYTLSDNPFWLVGVQLLDGVGAGIFGAIFPVIVADLMRNTGRFNIAQGAVITAQSIGAALSTTLAGLVVVVAGYSAAFLILGAVAAIGAIICVVALPETRQFADGAPRAQGKTAAPASVIAAE
ncbi:hypothetical protein ABIB06_005317 [Bradyrhizobium sp. LB8.2]